MDYDSSSKFISSLAKFLQSLCNGYVEFDNGVQVIGHLYLSVDTGRTIDYVLNEKVCKTDENSVTFISNSFHAQPAEKPKQLCKKKPDANNEDKDKDQDIAEHIEPRSTNFGTVQSLRASDRNSPQSQSGKRPVSPSQRHSRDSSGRMSPKIKRSRIDSVDPQSSNLNNESNSSVPSPADEKGPVSLPVPSSDAPQDTSFSDSYPQTFFSPEDEEHSAEESERDVKPSLDTDVTFIKEEYAPPSCSQSENRGHDRNHAEDSSMYPSMFPSHPSFPHGAYSNQSSFGAPPGGSQRTNFSTSNDRHSNLYTTGQSSLQLEPGENTSDPSGFGLSTWMLGGQASSLRQDGSLMASHGDGGTVCKFPATRYIHGCSLCGRKFTLKSHAKRHEAKCKVGVKVPCPVCGKVFGHADSLSQHVALDHSNHNLF